MTSRHQDEFSRRLNLSFYGCLVFFPAPNVTPGRSRWRSVWRRSSADTETMFPRSRALGLPSKRLFSRGKQKPQVQRERLRGLYGRLVSEVGAHNGLLDRVHHKSQWGFLGTPGPVAANCGYDTAHGLTILRIVSRARGHREAPRQAMTGRYAEYPRRSKDVVTISDGPGVGVASTNARNRGGGGGALPLALLRAGKRKLWGYLWRLDRGYFSLAQFFKVSRCHQWLMMP